MKNILKNSLLNSPLLWRGAGGEVLKRKPYTSSNSPLLYFVCSPSPKERGLGGEVLIKTIFLSFFLGLQFSYAQNIFQGYDVTGTNPNCYSCDAIQNFTANAVGTLSCGKIESTAEVTVSFTCKTLRVLAEGIILTDGLQASAGCEVMFKASVPPPTPPLPPITTSIDKFEDILISAEDIGEAAVYNWYDSEGNLVFVGKDITIANAVAETYKVEVISSVDGFKTYEDVEVVYKPNRLVNLYPNPTQGNIDIEYKINEANSAYLMVLNYYMNSPISNNYVIDINNNQANLDLSSYPNGFYRVALVADGVIVDVKLISKY